MADYRENTTAGTSWTRATAVNIYNPLGGIPSVSFVSEKAIQLDGGQPITIPDSRYLGIAFEATGEFPLVNPITGELTGTTGSHMDLYVLFHSLFIHLATQADIQQAGCEAAVLALKISTAEAEVAAAIAAETLAVEKLAYSEALVVTTTTTLAEAVAGTPEHDTVELALSEAEAALLIAQTVLGIAQALVITKATMLAELTTV
jgi:hypothetical protein